MQCNRSFVSAYSTVTMFGSYLSSPARFTISVLRHSSPWLFSSVSTLPEAVNASSHRTKKPLLSESPYPIHPFKYERHSPSIMFGHLASYLKATASYCTGNRPDVSKEVFIQHLLVKEDDLQLVQELEKRALGGVDLSDLAVEYSICPSKERGGKLGWVRKGQMVLEFEEAAFSAPINKVVKCKTKFGWHLLQVLSEREESILEEITPSDLHTKLQDPSFSKEVQLIDVREPEEVDRASVPGFHVLPLGQLGTWGPEITTNFDPEKETYVLCHHGRRSLQVAKWLQRQGFRRVFNVSGGIHEYAVKVDQSIPTY